MTRKDKRILSTAVAAITLFTASGFHTVNRKAEEYEASMNTIVVRSTAWAVEETEPEIAVPVMADGIPGGTDEAEPVEVMEEPDEQSLGTFKLTAYCACPKCCGEWSDGTTYTGTRATAGRTIAVDPDVIPLGSTVNINGHTYVAEDIGGAIDGNRIDIFFSSHTDALEFGVQYAQVSIEK